MKRSQAADLIDELREIVAHRQALRVAVPLHRLESLLAKYNLEPLQPCEGEAHSNAHIDNCMRCAPRWGFVGEKEPVR